MGYTDIQKGDWIKFKDDKDKFEVIGRNDRFIICSTKRSKDGKFFYTIIDTVDEIRGEDNYVFGIYNYRDEKDVEEALLNINDGETYKDENDVIHHKDGFSISRRNRVPLMITAIIKK